MNLLERYLQAVRFFLPQGQQEDIIRELRENLISQMEDRQEELGRELDEAEQADILRRHGHPMIVAGRYRSHQYVIGPAFFPIYVFALEMGLGVALIVTVVFALVTAALHGDPVRHAVDAMLAFPRRGLMVFAWTTLAFALLDIVRARLRLGHDWDPRSLPRLATPEHRIPRLRTICELLLGVAVVVWLLLLPQAPFLILGPAAPYVAAAPIWGAVYVPIVLLSLATVALYAVNFARPHWTRARSVARIALSSGVLLVAGYLMRAGELFVARSSSGAALPEGLQVDQLVTMVNAGFQIGLFVTIVISVIEIVREAYRLKTRRGLPPDAATAHVAH